MDQSQCPTRHFFLQRIAGTRLEELDLRAEHDSPRRGSVLEADYLQPARKVNVLLAWLRSFAGRPPAARMKLVAPFTSEGDDVHHYFHRARTEEFNPHNDSIGEVRRARGRILCLEPRVSGDEEVLRDFWMLEAGGWRITDAVDFGVLTPSGHPVAVCCAMAPIVIGAPNTIVAETHLRLLHPVHTAMLCDEERKAASRSGLRVVLREGDEVEVLGVVCDALHSRRFDLRGRGPPFRSGGFVSPARVLGDIAGRRMVIRRIPA